MVNVMCILPQLKTLKTTPPSACKVSFWGVGVDGNVPERLVVRAAGLCNRTETD